MSRFCSSCGIPVSDDARFCKACGTLLEKAPTLSAVFRNQEVLSQNLACCLAYFLGFVTGLILLNIEKYRNSELVRFHAWQSIYFSLVTIAYHLIGILTLRFVFSHIISVVMNMLILLGIFVVWVLLMIRAYRGEKLVLPILGRKAQERAFKQFVED